MIGKEAVTMVSYSPAVKQGLHRLRKYAFSGIYKDADIGGDGNDSSFENAFSSVAHAFMRAKAPTLLDYEVGFQCLDTNEDRTKAIGVFAFKVGSQWMFAPVFFLNGDLKGHELLYLKSQDAFVPLKENWLNYLLNRKPNLLGKSVTRNSRSLGVIQPDMSQLSRTPYKRAFVQPSRQEIKEAFAGILPVLADMATSSVAGLFAKIGSQLSLPEFLKQADLATLERLVGWCREMPKLAAAIDEFHGLQVVAEAIKLAGQRERAANSILGPDKPAPRMINTGSVLDEPLELQDPIKTGELKIITHDFTEQTELPDGLTEEDGEKLRKDLVLITDKRDSQKTTIPYHTVTDKAFFNPVDTGLYEILTRPGKFERCLVITKPIGAVRRESFSIVVRLQEPRNWKNVPSRNLWAVCQYTALDGSIEWNKWFDGLPETTELKTGYSDRYVVIGPKGNGTLPFRVVKDLYAEYGGNCYEVDFDSYCPGPYDFPVTGDTYGPRVYDYHEEGCHGSRIHIDGKDGRDIRANRGDVYIPKGFKVLAIKSEKSDKPSSDGDPMSDCCGGSDGQSENPPIEPGNLTDVELQIMGKTASFTLWNDGCNLEINHGPRLSPLGALVSLVRDHGFREETARDLIKRSAVKRKLTCRVIYPPYLRKQADPFLTNQGPSSPSFPPVPYGGNSIMGSSVQTQLPMEASLPVPGMAPEMGNRSVYDPTQNLSGPERQQLSTAVESGQKEIFDTSAIGGLLKAVRDDSMVGRYLGPLMKALDAVGRIEVMFYWHGDRFAERYGSSEMPELEDTLRNTFEMLGDLVLFLKQKEIAPSPEENDVGVDLSPSANT